MSDLMHMHAAFFLFWFGFFGLSFWVFFFWPGIVMYIHILCDLNIFILFFFPFASDLLNWR